MLCWTIAVDSVGLWPTHSPFIHLLLYLGNMIVLKKILVKLFFLPRKKLLFFFFLLQIG